MSYTTLTLVAILISTLYANCVFAQDNILSTPCEIPPYYESINEDEDAPFEVVAKTHYGEHNAYMPGKIVGVEVTQHHSQIADFIFWFELPNSQVRVGSWIPSLSPPRSTIYKNCGGDENATLINQRPIGKPFLRNDFKLLWRAPSDIQGQLILRGTIVRQRAGVRTAWTFVQPINLSPEFDIEDVPGYIEASPEESDTEEIPVDTEETPVDIEESSGESDIEETPVDIEETPVDIEESSEESDIEETPVDTEESFEESDSEETPVDTEETLVDTEESSGESDSEEAPVDIEETPVDTEESSEGTPVDTEETPVDTEESSEESDSEEIPVDTEETPVAEEPSEESDSEEIPVETEETPVETEESGAFTEPAVTGSSATGLEISELKAPLDAFFFGLNILPIETINTPPAPIPAGATNIDPEVFFGPRGPCVLDEAGETTSFRVLPLWQFPFRVPPTAVESPNITVPRCDAAGRCWKVIEITAAENPVQLFPDGPPTILFSFGQNGLFTTPGPTIKTCSGQQVFLRIHNRIPNRISIHLHGSASAAPYDGWADEITLEQQFKDYFYPSNRMATLWYHDHAFLVTSDNALRGLLAQYWVEDCCRDFTGILPAPQYDVPLVITDASFDVNNQILLDKTIVDDVYYGDHQFINGIPWPVLTAEPRVYRFRTLDSSLGRTYILSLQSIPNVKIPFYAIATEGGLLERPAEVFTIRIAPAERIEIIVDLRNFAGQTIYLFNEEEDDLDQAIFCQTHVLMRIDVTAPLEVEIPDVIWTREQFLATPLLPGGLLPGEKLIPRELREIAAALPFGTFDREISFVRNGGQWKIDVEPPIDQIIQANLVGALSWTESLDLPQPHVVADPEANKIEIWEIVNGGGGWHHPVHTHLVDSIIVARDEVPLPPWEANAVKDTFLIGPGESLRVITRYGPHAGSFMFHCHNLIHEDDDMLLAFGTQHDHPVVRILGDNLFQNEQFIVVPVSPINSLNDFENSLRNPMLPSERAQPEPPLLSLDETLLREQIRNTYFVFYPDPARVNTDGTTPPIGANLENPWEVDYLCLSRPPVPVELAP